MPSGFSHHNSIINNYKETYTLLKLHHLLSSVYKACKEVILNLENMEDTQNIRKRSRRSEKKKKVEEIEKPRGLARGLLPEKIVAGQLFNGTLYYLVKWQDCSELDVVPGQDFGQSFPNFIIQYYESCVPFSVRHKVGKVPRVAPELPPEIMMPPPASSAVVSNQIKEDLVEKTSKEDTPSTATELGTSENSGDKQESKPTELAVN